MNDIDRIAERLRSIIVYSEEQIGTGSVSVSGLAPDTPLRMPVGFDVDPDDRDLALQFHNDVSELALLADRMGREREYLNEVLADVAILLNPNSSKTDMILATVRLTREVDAWE